MNWNDSVLMGKTIFDNNEKGYFGKVVEIRGPYLVVERLDGSFLTMHLNEISRSSAFTVLADDEESDDDDDDDKEAAKKLGLLTLMSLHVWRKGIHRDSIAECIGMSEDDVDTGIEWICHNCPHLLHSEDGIYQFIGTTRDIREMTKT